MKVEGGMKNRRGGIKGKKMGREEVYVSGSNWYLWKDMLELKIIPGIHILYNPLLYQLYTYSYIHICSKCPTPKKFLEPYLSKYNSDSLDYQCEQLSTPVLPIRNYLYLYVSTKPNYSQHYNQSGLSISTKVLEVYI